MGPSELGPRTPWEELARCRQPEVNPDWFFPERGEQPDQAKAVCRRCPVKVQCLNYAMRARVREGVWGGLSDRERRKLARLVAA